MNYFDNETTTLEHLTKNKKPDCVTALKAGYDLARSEGLGFREAYYKAELTHFVNDHDGANNPPELTIPTTDEAVRHAIVTDVKDTEDGKAVGALLLKWYDLFRSWDIGVALSFTSAISAGREEWEDTHDLDEAEGISALNEIPDENLKDVALTAFYSSRNKGASVYASLRTAKEELERAQLLSLLGSLGAGLGGRGLLN